MQNNNKDNGAYDLALFRYTLISPVISKIHSFPTDKAYFLDLINKYPKCNNTDVNLSLSSLKRWTKLYREGGLNALVTKKRCDCNKSRKIDNAIILKIKELFSEFPFITGTMIYHKLIEQDLINQSNVSYLQFLR